MVSLKAHKKQLLDNNKGNKKVTSYFLHCSNFICSLCIVWIGSRTLHLVSSKKCLLFLPQMILHNNLVITTLSAAVFEFPGLCMQFGSVFEWASTAALV